MDSMGEGRKIFWDSTSHAIFVECCIEEVKKGNKPGSHFNKIGWKNLITNFNARARKDYTKLQLKNHWDAMKKDWKLWNRLMRMEPGIEWDPIRKTVDVSPEWWEDKIRADPELAKFRDRNLEMYKMYYEHLFGDSFATGDKAVAPSELPCTTGRRTSVDETASEGREDTGERDDMGYSDDTTHDDTADKEDGNGVRGQQCETLGIASPEATLKRGSSQHPSNSNAKKAKMSTTVALQKQLDAILQVLSNRAFATSPAVTGSDEPSIADCTRIFAELPGVDIGSEFWNEVCLLFWKKEVRMGFASQPTPEAKLSYVKFIVRKTKEFPLYMFADFLKNK